MRFFVAGSGLFTLHVGDRVYEVLCEQGDLIGVPDGTPHWFDMGAAALLHGDPAVHQPGRLGRQLHRLRHRRALSALRALSAAGIGPPAAVVVDIEGTVGSIRFVKDVLFPFARARLRAFVLANRTRRGGRRGSCDAVAS